MPIHLIDASEHRAFLEQERIDPITGETIKAGDEVVFCAACKSAFLADSWNYLEEAHCGQSDTLREFPQPKSLSFTYEPIQLERFPLEGLLFDERVSELSTKQYLLHILGATLGAAGLASLFSVWADGDWAWREFLTFFWPLALIMTGRSFFNLGLNFFKHLANGLSDERGEVCIYTNGLYINAKSSFLSKGWTARFKDIRKIVFLQRKKRWGGIKTYLEIHLRDRRKQRIRLSRDPGGLRKCLWALQKIGYFVDIELGLKRKSEISFVNTLTRRYETHFRILPDEERLRLLQG